MNRLPFGLFSGGY